MDQPGLLENIQAKKAQMQKERYKAIQQIALYEQRLEQAKETFQRIDGAIMVLDQLITENQQKEPESQ